MKSHDFIIVNGDTDSISFKKQDETPFTEDEQRQLLDEINALLPKGIIFKNDKHYRRVIVCKAKNYVLDDGKKVKIKGDGLKGSKREPAIRKFTRDAVDLLLKGKKDQVILLYLDLVQKIMSFSKSEIDQWCFKVTVTKKVLDPKGGFQKKIKAALAGTDFREGDKFYLYFRPDKSLARLENFNDDIDRNKLIKKLRASMKVFEHIMDINLIPKFSKRKKASLPTGQFLTRN